MKVEYATPTNQAIPPKTAAARPGRWRTFYRKLRKNKLAMVGGFIVVFYIAIALLAPLIAPHDPYAIDLLGKLKPPSAEHWMGTDDKGRDVLSRLLYGTRLSMSVGFVAVFIGAFFGIILGLLAGYYGKWVDTVISRVIDILIGIPGYPAFSGNCKRTRTKLVQRDDRRRCVFHSRIRPDRSRFYLDREEARVHRCDSLTGRQRFHYHLQTYFPKHSVTDYRSGNHAPCNSDSVGSRTFLPRLGCTTSPAGMGCHAE